MISDSNSSNRLAAVVEVGNRGTLVLFQPLLYSQHAEHFIERGFQDFESAETKAYLKQPVHEVALPPIFLVRDVLLVACVNRNKPQPTCGVCQVEPGCMVGPFPGSSFFFIFSFLSFRTLMK
jgi:hypothetical protein